MDTGSPEFWRWVWLIAAVTFGIGEMALAGSFFLAPFAAGAGVAAILAFAGVGVGIEWLAFIGVSVVAFAALRPVAHRLDREGPVLGIGSHRQVGQIARVITPIDGTTQGGAVLLGSETWRAESSGGEVIPAGSNVAVLEVRGTRLVVRLEPSGAVLADPPDA